MLNGPELRCATSNGALLLIARPDTGIPASAIRRHGWARDGSNCGYFETGAVAAGARRIKGLALTPDGALYVTNSAPGATSRYVDGFAISADGALHVTTDDNIASTRGKNGLARAGGRARADFITPILPYVDRYWDTRYNVTSSSERVSNWLDMKQGTDLAQASGAAQPILLPYGGVNYLWLPGVVGNYASAPDSVPLSITGDIDIRVNLAANVWASGALQTVVAKEGGSTTRSYHLGIGATGTIYFSLSADGTNAVIASSTAAVGFANRVSGWIRTNWNQATKEVTHYTSTDGVNWVQLGTTVALNIASIYDSPSALEVGARRGGSIENFDGKIYSAQIYNGIDGTLAFDANFATVPEGATSFVESSANAATVTINSTGAKPAQIVGRPWAMGDAAALFLQTAALTIPAPYFLCAAVRFNLWASGDVLFDGATANSFAAQQITGTPQIRMHDGSADSSTVSPVLTTKYILFASQAADGSLRFRLNLGAAVTGTLSATALAGLTLLGDGAGNNEIGAQVAAFSQGSIAPTVAQEEQLIRAMAAQIQVSL
jgi:hypothetical protein